MKEIIAIVNRRGGVGKTATAHAIGAGLARRGYKTLFIDLDSQCNLTFDVGGKTAPIGSLEVLRGSATAKEAIQHAAGGDIIPASKRLSTADKIIDGKGKEYRLRDALAPITAAYDYIIIDTPPALGVLTVNALTASNSTIIPARPEVHSIHGIQLLYEAISAVKRYTNPNITIKGILITHYNQRSNLCKDMKSNLEEAAKDLGTKVFSTPIRTCTAIAEAQALQTDIYSYSPRSNGAADYKALIDEITNKER